MNEAPEGVQSIPAGADEQAKLGGGREDGRRGSDVSEVTTAEAQTVSAAAGGRSASLNQVSREIRRALGEASDLSSVVSRSF